MSTNTRELSQHMPEDLTRQSSKLHKRRHSFATGVSYQEDYSQRYPEVRTLVRGGGQPSKPYSEHHSSRKGEANPNAHLASEKPPPVPPKPAFPPQYPSNRIKNSSSNTKASDSRHPPTFGSHSTYAPELSGPTWVQAFPDSKDRYPIWRERSKSQAVAHEDMRKAFRGFFYEDSKKQSPKLPKVKAESKTDKITSSKLPPQMAPLRSAMKRTDKLPTSSRKDSNVPSIVVTEGDFSYPAAYAPFNHHEYPQVADQLVDSDKWVIEYIPITRLKGGKILVHSPPSGWAPSSSAHSSPRTTTTTAEPGTSEARSIRRSHTISHPSGTRNDQRQVRFLARAR